jgi:hypothetical protein
VSWFYNWYFQTTDLPPAELAFEFLPMVWGDQPERLAGLESWLAAGHRPRVVFSANEPNLKGQAFITPQVCADLQRRVVALAERYHLPVVGPHMAIGSAPADSITAEDPLAGKPVTYTWMMPYLTAFNHHLGGTPMHGLGIHAYGDIHELRWAVEATWKEFQRPVWVTEFAQWGAKDEVAERDYLVQAVDFLERSPHVAGYAWFKERSTQARISLLAAEPGALTALGAAYVGMPVIEPGLRYQVPGRIQAEAAATLSACEVRATGDEDGLAELRGGAGANAVFSLASGHGGAHTLLLRASGTGEVSVSVGGQTSVVSLTGKTWQTSQVQVSLPKGASDLTLAVASGRVAINWVEIAAVR